MPQITSPTSSGYKYLSQAKPLARISRSSITNVAYAIFTFTITLLLVSLGIRMFAALFVFDNAFIRGITIFTDPIVRPFSYKFNDMHEMLQASTASTFTFYYLAYFIVASVNKLFTNTDLRPVKTLN